MKKITAALKSAFQAGFERTGEEAQDFQKVAKEQIFGPKEQKTEVKTEAVSTKDSLKNPKAPKIDSLTGLPIIPKKKLSGFMDAVNKEKFLQLTELRKKLAKQRSGATDDEQVESNSQGPAVISSTDKNKLDPAAVTQLKRNSQITGEAEKSGG